jgi:hypothetical protein
MPFEFGDVVLVPFPFTSQTNSKKRPAVIVSNRTYNTAKPDVVVMPITSRLPSFFGVGEVLVGQWHTAAYRRFAQTFSNQAGFRHSGTTPHHPPTRHPRRRRPNSA